MRARLTHAALARFLPAACGAILLAACGSQQSERPAVAGYIKQAGQIETQLATPLADVSQAGSEFAQARPGGHTNSVLRLPSVGPESTLLSAWTRIESVRRRLAALPAPAAAARLRTLLLELTDFEAGATREVASLVAFLPRFAATLAPLGPATQRLDRALSQPSVYGAAAVAAAYTSKAAALRRFQRSVDAIRAGLVRLHPPPVSTPGYRAQLGSLRGMSVNAGKLATALSQGTVANVQQLLTDFDRAALSTESRAVQKAEIASIRAYDSQSAKAAELSAQVDSERQRLADTVR